MDMNIRHVGASVICLFAMQFGLPALAAIPGQATTPSGSSFASGCAGTELTGGFAQDGNAIAGGSSSIYYNCSTQTSAPGGTAAVSVAKTGVQTYSGSPAYPFSGTGVASASIGTLHLTTTSSGSSATQFSGAQAMAGWNDTVEIAGAAGQTGVWLFSLAVDGTLSSTGPGADSQLGIIAMQNNAQIKPYGDAGHAAAYAAFQAANGTPGTDVYYSFDSELKPWRETQYGVDKLLTLSNAAAYFAVPFTYNVPFTLGLYGFVSSGSGSSGAYVGQNASVVDVANTITWTGKGVLLTNGGAGPSTTNFSVDSLTSGFNYNIAAVPETTSWALMVLGFGFAGVALRRSRRRSSIPPAAYV